MYVIAIVAIVLTYVFILFNFIFQRKAKNIVNSTLKFFPESYKNDDIFCKFYLANPGIWVFCLLWSQKDPVVKMFLYISALNSIFIAISIILLIVSFVYGVYYFIIIFICSIFILGKNNAYWGTPSDEQNIKRCILNFKAKYPDEFKKFIKKDESLVRFYLDDYYTSAKRFTLLQRSFYG